MVGGLSCSNGNRGDVLGSGLLLWRGYAHWVNASKPDARPAGRLGGRREHNPLGRSLSEPENGGGYLLDTLLSKLDKSVLDSQFPPC